MKNIYLASLAFLLVLSSFSFASAWGGHDNLYASNIYTTQQYTTYETRFPQNFYFTSDNSVESRYDSCQYRFGSDCPNVHVVRNVYTPMRDCGFELHNDLVYYVAVI